MGNKSIKQWFKDYLDFAMPLLMTIIALNVTYSIIPTDIPAKFPYRSDAFFRIDSHLSVFMQQVVSGKLFLYSLIFLGSALFLRLFTKRLRTIFKIPFVVLWIYAVVFIGFKKGGSDIAVIMMVDGLVVFAIYSGLFTMLKIAFANFNNFIKIILYVIISILSVLILLSNLEIIKLSLIVNQNIFIGIMCFLLIYIIYSAIMRRKKDEIVPQDIRQYHIDSELEAENTLESIKEKQRRRNAIIDLIDEYKKHR